MIFLDTCDIDAIEKFHQIGICQGVTTNPSMVTSKEKFTNVLKRICAIGDLPVSAQVIATEVDEMLKEADQFLSISDNIVIKLPTTENGLKACNILSSQDVCTNMTLCFTPEQAILASLAGATFISMFIGRLEDAGQDAIETLHKTSIILAKSEHPSLLLAASIRNKKHVTDAFAAGADIATCQVKIIEEMMYSDLTNRGLDKFMADFKACNGKL